MLNVLGSVAQFEREMMLERQREGIAKAKAEGKYQGRKVTATKPANFITVADRLGRGDSPAEVARDLGISRSSLYRIKGRLNAYRREKQA